MIDGLAIARAIHVAAVMHWIGGVFFVTFVILPSLATIEAGQRLGLFDRIERRFATQARISTLLAGLSGFYLLQGFQLWGQLLDPRTWWLPAMFMLWVVFTLMLYVLEPLVLHRWFETRAARDPDGTFRLVLRMHRILSALTALTVLGGVAGAHGFSF